MRSLEFVPVSELSESEIHNHGWELHELITQKATKQMLKRLNLQGVLKRHSTFELSKATLAEARRKAEAKTLGTFVIQDRTETPNQVIGLATTLPNLPLRKMPVAFPAAVLRRSNYGSLVDVPPLNVSAWTQFDPTNTLRFVEDQTQAYSFLHAEAPHSWTLSSRRANEVDDGSAGTIHQQALENAGYRAVGGLGLYDELESSWLLPQSTLFMDTDSIIEGTQAA